MSYRVLSFRLESLSIPVGFPQDLVASSLNEWPKRAVLPSNLQNCREAAGARSYPAYVSKSVSQISSRSRASGRGAISSSRGTRDLLPRRPRAPSLEPPLLWITHQDLAARLLFVFAESTCLSLPTELCSARSPKGFSRELDANRASPCAVRFLHSRLNRRSISPVRRELGAET